MLIMHVVLQSTVAMLKRIIISYGIYNHKIFAMFLNMRSEKYMLLSRNLKQSGILKRNTKKILRLLWFNPAWLT